MLTNGPSGEGSVDQADRALIDQLIAATRLYKSSEAVQELFDFVVRLREFAPFNAMLLHIQKPGLTHAATARDWWSRFGCAPKLGARPLLILRVMGPVDFVFDILDVEGARFLRTPSVSRHSETSRKSASESSCGGSRGTGS